MIKKFWLVFVAAILAPQFAHAAGEASLVLPKLTSQFVLFGKTFFGRDLMYGGLGVCILGMLFGLFEYLKVKRLPAHKSMLEVSNIIYETCKTYLFQQAKLLIVLELFIGACIFYYFYSLLGMPLDRVLTILGWSVIGILGSFSVAWFGIRINTLANSRTAFASLRGKPYWVCKIPLRAGISIGVLLICIELIMMLTILLFVNPTAAGSCFIGFAIGESLGASALRICGGIFTKIADIGSDLMKIVFNIKEDDARNPGVIADCTGDNAGDSVGPTADGFETYGVTGVALITFIVLAVLPQFKSDFIIWIFAMRVLMILTSIGAYALNSVVTAIRLKEKDKFNFEAPLTELVWLTSLISIGVTFGVSYLLLHANYGSLWLTLSIIISCGTLAAAIIPELTKVFTSCHSKHVQEIVSAGKEGGASLVILSGLVAGNFSCFWKGISIIGLMFVAFLASQYGLETYMGYPTVFAFGLVAFGLLGMGPVTIAVDSYGPVTDNAQSVFELSLIEQVPNINQEVQKDFGFTPNFVKGKHFLEENDGAGNTFKATAKPVLIATAVIGATTMIFSLILLLKEHFHWEKIGAELSIIDPHVLLGIITGGAVIYWFTGASMQAVTTGAYRAVEYIKKNIRLEGATKASIHDSKEVVKICTQYAQAGMVNIFGVIFCFTLAFACFSPTFFVGYLISIAVFGLYQAIFMANGGGAWDNAKKLVEVEMKEKGTPLHAATVVGDTVGDPYKDTSSVALNPIIKFTTLFGLLAVEIAISEGAAQYVHWVGTIFFLIGTFFVWRSFYKMRIKSNASENAITTQARTAKLLA
ncbi:MAG: sodium-translocating pyrophosphatase [Deltaproteobacteria bacterium]|nr:sodium-translocating pyrophosphatase [Deltaproteobacteria bacterium]